MIFNERFNTDIFAIFRVFLFCMLFKKVILLLINNNKNRFFSDKNLKII